ncbi:[NiFe]-hydrogenase assembly chaperone HybE [Aquabacterium sp. OR-4]|uniref:[NiFe]-hydrogenase assembly chaperone HybE n=1 Tax=Aquabacterium sp. OR-4 TaxID=2978127 RepID=UPI0028C7E1BA|nr:[NiFe]-hydrogenase assembly chaperone HybE [Aquabacterium sp. OR-4]MDT7833623.1 [NiFe]-hydrogenase assembly chaperone HybE [Aquabacterium sp. OR-4]
MDPQLLTRRVEALESAFRHIARSRMAGVPILHPSLAVQAVGFAPAAAGGHSVAPGLALGVLITPWFMNLVQLPLHDEAALELPPPGLSQALEIGAWRFDFFGGEEDGLGRYAAASLFSPMAEFVDQAAAVATAREVLLQLRPVAAAPGRVAPQPRSAAAPASAAVATTATTAATAATAAEAAAMAVPPAGPQAEPVPARRGFLFGRPAAGGGRR